MSPFSARSAVGHRYLPEIGMITNAFEDVLEAARDGHSWAFKALYDWLSRPITAFVVGKGISDPGPVVNEVFLGAFRGLQRFEGNAEDFRKWTYGIARHKIIDARRIESRQVTGVPVDSVGEHAAIDDVEHDVIVQLSTERVEILLDSLTEDQRDVLLLRMVGDMTVPQIADVLGKPQGAIKALQRRALRRLAAALESEEVTL